MNKSRSFLSFALSLSLIIFIACRSSKPSQDKAIKSKIDFETLSLCEQPIRYYAEKLKANSGMEMDAKTEIVINPLTKLISLTSVTQNEKKESFETVIESLDCNLSSDLSSGQAIYRGYIKQMDGSTTKAIIKVEAKEGGLTISNANPEKPGELIIPIVKWEIVRE